MLTSFCLSLPVKRALHFNKLNSTHLPSAARTDKGPSRVRARTNHVDEDRWRALIDSDSGTDASDDDDADATYASDSSDSGSSGVAGDNVTYLDLTEEHIRVVGRPTNDSPESKCEHTCQHTVTISILLTLFHFSSSIPKTT